jgi:hypothetical protein
MPELFSLMPANEKNETESSRQRQIRHLRELVAALDRRVPHIERAGEAAIARDAAILREKALKRIATLELDEQTP